MCLCTCLGLLSGCASLPRDVIRPTSDALSATAVAGGALARLVESGHAADESGFRLLPTGAYAFNTRVALARRAQFSLDLQYYVIHDVETGRALLHELEAAAARGVRVRLLVDDIATETQDQSLLRLATMPNISVRIFNPFAWGRSSATARILSSLGDLKRINHRMHNKSFIADNLMAVTGGRNLGDEYFMYGSNSNFVDLDVFAAGPVVGGMLLGLMGAAQKEVVVVSPYFVPGKPGMRLMRKLHAQGVQMSVLTNSLAATDTPIVHTGYARYRVEMLQLGVHLYELSPTRGHDEAKLGLFGSSRAKLHAKTAVIDRQQLFVGSINLDARSARENTEQGLIIRSPALAGEVLQLLENDHGESAYRLCLAPDRSTIEWIATSGGIESKVDTEPDAPFWLRLGLWLLGPVAPEELL